MLFRLDGLHVFVSFNLGISFFSLNRNSTFKLLYFLLTDSFRWALLSNATIVVMGRAHRHSWYVTIITVPVKKKATTERIENNLLNPKPNIMVSARCWLGACVGQQLPSKYTCFSSLSSHSLILSNWISTVVEKKERNICHYFLVATYTTCRQWSRTPGPNIHNVGSSRQF